MRIGAQILSQYAQLSEAVGPDQPESDPWTPKRFEEIAGATDKLNSQDREHSTYKTLGREPIIKHFDVLAYLNRNSESRWIENFKDVDEPIFQVLLLRTTSQNSLSHGIDIQATMICAAYQLLEFSPAVELPVGYELSCSAKRYPHRFRKNQKSDTSARKILGWTLEQWNMSLAFVESFFRACVDRHRNPLIKTQATTKSLEWRLTGDEDETPEEATKTTSPSLTPLFSGTRIQDVLNQDLNPSSLRDSLFVLDFFASSRRAKEAMSEIQGLRFNPAYHIDIEKLSEPKPKELDDCSRELSPAISLSLLRHGEALRPKLSSKFHEALPKSMKYALQDVFDVGHLDFRHEDHESLKLEWSKYATMQNISSPRVPLIEPDLEQIGRQYGIGS